jgi:histone-lysine N-methyltransferase SETMAR
LRKHFQHLLYEFNRGPEAAEVARNICAVYEEDPVTERTAQKWFARFKKGNFDMSDTPRSRQPADFDNDLLNASVHADPRQTTRELASEMGCAHATIVRHLQSTGKVQKLGVWVPHILTQDNKNQRVAICASLFVRQHHQSFLSRIVTGDEKWCLYVNFKLIPDKQATPCPKPDLHTRKIMLCIWWDMKGIIHYELLERNLTVTADRCCQQLRRLGQTIQQKRPSRQHGVILQHVSARPHTANMTKATIQEFDWEILRLLHGQTLLISSSVGSITCPNIGRQS